MVFSMCIGDRLFDLRLSEIPGTKECSASSVTVKLEKNNPGFGSSYQDTVISLNNFTGTLKISEVTTSSKKDFEEKDINNLLLNNNSTSIVTPSPNSSNNRFYDDTIVTTAATSNNNNNVNEPKTPNRCHKKRKLNEFNREEERIFQESFSVKDSDININNHRRQRRSVAVACKNIQANKELLFKEILLEQDVQDEEAKEDVEELIMDLEEASEVYCYYDDDSEEEEKIQPKYEKKTMKQKNHKPKRKSKSKKTFSFEDSQEKLLKDRFSSLDTTLNKYYEPPKSNNQRVKNKVEEEQSIAQQSLTDSQLIECCNVNQYEAIHPHSSNINHLSEFYPHDDDSEEERIKNNLESDSTSCALRAEFLDELSTGDILINDPILHTENNEKYQEVDELSSILSAASIETSSSSRSSSDEDDLPNNLLGIEPKQGMRVDSRDEDNIWSAATITKVEFRRSCNNKAVKTFVTLHYDGWGHKYNETRSWPNSDNNDRLAQLFTYTKEVKCFAHLNPTNNTSLWPCKVQFRMPHPGANTFNPYYFLQKEPNIYVVPYAAKSLPKMYASKSTDGGFWIPSTQLCPWQTFLTQDTLGTADSTLKGFDEAFELAMKDMETRAVLPEGALEKGTLLKKKFRVTTLNGKPNGQLCVDSNYKSSDEDTDDESVTQHHHERSYQRMNHPFMFTKVIIKVGKVKYHMRFGNDSSCSKLQQHSVEADFDKQRLV